MVLKPILKKGGWSLILFVVLLFVAYGSYIYPHVVSVGDWLYPNPMRLVQALYWPNIFQSGNIEGYYGILLPGTVLAAVFSILYSVVHLSVPIITSLLYFVPAIAVMAVGIWRLLRALGYGDGARLVGALLYVINPFVLTLLFGGQVNGVIAYGCIPWVILCGDALWRQPTKRSAVAVAVWLTVQALYEPRYIFITGIIGLVWFGCRLFQGRPSRASVRYAFLAAGVFVLLNAFWIYGVFFVPGTAQIPAGYGDPSWLVTLSYATIWHALFLHHVWWPVSGTVSEPVWYFAVWPLMALIGILTAKRGTIVRAMFVLLIIGIWLAKGVNPPLGEIYRWLFIHIIGFSGFRDPAKFFTIIAFAYAVSVPAGIDYLLKIFSKRRVVQIVFGMVFTGVFLFGFQSLWLQRAGDSQDPKSQVVADGVINWLDQQPDGSTPYSTFWIPTMHRYGNFDSMHPAILANDDPLRIVRQRLPGLDQWINNVNEATNYLPSLRYILSSYGVRYVVVPGDATAEFYNAAYPYSQQQLSDSLRDSELFTQSQVVPDKGGTSSEVFTYTDAAPKAFLSQRAVITDTVTHPLLADLLREGPTKNLLFWNNDLLNQDRSIVDQKAAYSLQQPELDADAAARGIISWRLVVGTTGNYRLGLFDNVATYQLDGEALTVNDIVDLNGVRYRFSDYQFLDAGEHVITMQLDTDRNQPLFDGASSAEWEPCPPADVSPLDGLDEGRNAAELRNQTWNSINNSAGDTRCIISNIAADLRSTTVMTRWQGTVTGHSPYVWLNIKQFSGENYLLQDLATTDTIYTNTSQLRGQAFIALILPYAQKSVVATEQLKIWKVMDAAHPATSMVLQPQDAVMATSDQEVVLQKERDYLYTLSIPAHERGTWLTVSTEYHPGWKLINRQTGVASDVHLSSLLRQNSWYLPEGVSGDFELIFTPYPRLFVAYTLSFFTAVAVLIYWVSRRRKNTQK